MSLLDRKLWRDISAMRGQVITIALVVARASRSSSLRYRPTIRCSPAAIASMPARASRRCSSRSSARRFRSLPQLNEIPGVAAVEPRIVRDVIVDWPSAMLPVSARMVSLTHAGDEPLARLHMRRGTAPGTE